MGIYTIGLEKIKGIRKHADVMGCAVPALLHAQTHTGRITGLRRGGVGVFGNLALAILLRLLRRDVGHAEDTGLHVETLGHLGAGALHGHDGYLAHLVGATRNLKKNKDSFVKK